MEKVIFDRANKVYYSEKIMAEKPTLFLYRNPLGRFFLKHFIIKKTASELAGLYYNSFLSKPKINEFINNYKIDMRLYHKKKYKCFNDFFIRKMKKSSLNINKNPRSLISPCYSKLSVFNISDELIVNIKGCDYTVASLLKDSELANEYKNGLCLVFRLTVDDYHRYSFFDNGIAGKNVKIPGVYHTVGTISNGVYNVYSENSREYTELFTENFDKVVFMEVGALMVGKIRNKPDVTKFFRGDEKGYFCFGGSTIILFLKENTVLIDDDILELSKNGTEVKVRLGEKIGTRYVL